MRRRGRLVLAPVQMLRLNTSKKGREIGLEDFEKVDVIRAALTDEKRQPIVEECTGEDDEQEPNS